MNIPLQKRYVVKLLLMMGFTITLALAYSSGPPPGCTGSFTDRCICTNCHGGHDIDDGVGSLTVDGVPPTYTPGACYPLAVTLQRPGQMRWGFELASRFQSANMLIHGLQAGDLSSLEGDIKTQVQIDGGVQFITQTTDGLFDGVVDGPVTWNFNWCAPDDALAMVSFDAAGNAANGDGTPAGDYIYTGFAISQPPK